MGAGHGGEGGSWVRHQASNVRQTQWVDEGIEVTQTDADMEH